MEQAYEDSHVVVVHTAEDAPLLQLEQATERSFFLNDAEQFGTPMSSLPHSKTVYRDESREASSSPDVEEEHTPDDVIEFILQYARLLHGCGLSSDKVEDKLITVSETLGVEASFLCLPNSMIVSFPLIMRLPSPSPSLSSSSTSVRGSSASSDAASSLNSSINGAFDDPRSEGESTHIFARSLFSELMEKKKRRRRLREKRKRFSSSTSTFQSSRTYLLTSSPSLNCNKLIRVSDLGNKITSGAISLSAAMQELDILIADKSGLHPLVYTACLMISSAALAPLFFGGDWIDGAIAMGVGMLVGLLSHLSGLSAGMKGLLEVLAALFASVISIVLARLLGGICYVGVSLASIAWLMPGLTLTIAMQELAANSFVSGTARMFNALLVLLELGFGLALGGRVIAYAWPGDIVNECPGVSMWWNFLFVPVTCICFQILLKPHPILWIPQFFAAIAGHLINWACTTYLSFHVDTAAALAAFCMGLLANIWARFTGHPAAPVVISGILLLVPGSIGVKGVSAMIEDDVVQGMKFGYLMISIALSIAVGLLVANLPFRLRSKKKASKYI